MEQQIGTFEAKTHFSQIIEKVEGGEDFVITRRGKPVAKLIEMRKLYRDKPGDFNIREAIEEGRT